MEISHLHHREGIRISREKIKTKTIKWGIKDHSKEKIKNLESSQQSKNIEIKAYQ